MFTQSTLRTDRFQKLSYCCPSARFNCSWNPGLKLRASELLSNALPFELFWHISKSLHLAAIFLSTEKYIYRIFSWKMLEFNISLRPNRHESYRWEASSDYLKWCFYDAIQGSDLKCQPHITSSILGKARYKGNILVYDEHPSTKYWYDMSESLMWNWPHTISYIENVLLVSKLDISKFKFGEECIRVKELQSEVYRKCGQRGGGARKRRLCSLTSISNCCLQTATLSTSVNTRGRPGQSNCSLALASGIPFHAVETGMTQSHWMHTSNYHVWSYSYQTAAAG